MTFSLLGRCARTGMLGAAVTTSSIAVGSRCSHARAGVGACLTQHRTDPRLGPLALDLLARGYDAPHTLQAVRAVAPHRRLAPACGHRRRGPHRGVHRRARGARQGRRGARQGLCRHRQHRALDRHPRRHGRARSRPIPTLPLARRLIDALAAGEAAGGEFVPVLSAALLVAHRESFPYVDLRVDSHTSPIAELDRLWRAYEPEAALYVTRANDPGAAPPA